VGLQRVTRITSLAAVVLSFCSSEARADEPSSAQDCIDALVSAKIVRQVPSIFPDCGDGCIVMSWPWFVDFEVKRVLKGRAPTGRITVLTVQHTSFRLDLPARPWALRRNDLGGFNLIRTGDSQQLPLCHRDASPAPPYIRPSEGRTLADLIREGELALEKED
jgi:hypothetical protein